MRVRDVTRMLATLLALAALSRSAPAHADDPAAAEALFRDARALFERGELESACEKFKQSQALDPSAGTLLNLAACHLRQGKTATAWAEFLAAERLARAQQKPRQESEASRQATRLEKDLSYLTIQVPDAVPGLEVRRGGELVQPGLYGSKVPVDPGEYELEVSAPGHETVALHVSVGDSRDQKTLVVPRLRAKPKPASVAQQKSETAPASPLPPNPAPLEASRHTNSTREIAWIVGGVGALALAGGGTFGVLALRSNSEAKDKCPVAAHCNDSGALDAAERRDRQATLATIGIGAGVVALGAAALLWFGSSSSSGEGATVQAGAWLMPGKATVALSTRF